MTANLVQETKIDTLVALSMWMDYDTALEMIKEYEIKEWYEVCQGMMEALELHSGATLNCRIGNIYYHEEL